MPPRLRPAGPMPGARLTTWAVAPGPGPSGPGQRPPVQRRQFQPLPIPATCNASRARPTSNRLVGSKTALTAAPLALIMNAIAKIMAAIMASMAASSRSAGTVLAAALKAQSAGRGRPVPVVLPGREDVVQGARPGQAARFYPVISSLIGHGR